MPGHAYFMKVPRCNATIDSTQLKQKSLACRFGPYHARHHFSALVTRRDARDREHPRAFQSSGKFSVKSTDLLVRCTPDESMLIRGSVRVTRNPRIGIRCVMYAVGIRYRRGSRIYGENRALYHIIHAPNWREISFLAGSFPLLFIRLPRLYLR